MKALVVGGGSIGSRHLRNLKALGADELACVEPDVERGQTLIREIGTLHFTSMEAGLDWRPDFALIASPTHLHVEHALEAARRGLDIFIEKPLSHSTKGLSELSDLVDRKKLVTLVGCNMRFHPGPAKVKELLEQGRIGGVLFARLHVGSYLPGWRPGTDYRNNYAAREETGGGCILDCIHEIDLARWYLGDAQDVFCLASCTGSLGIRTEDIAAVLCRHVSGVTSEIHLDYVQRTYERGCQIVGEQGSIFWDFNLGQVRCFEANSGKWITISQPAGWEPNQMYLQETQHFLDCVRTRHATALPVSDASVLMQIVFAAKTSAQDGRLVAVGKEVMA